MKFLVINGPNMNMLGIREPDIYGRVNYDGLVKLISDHAAKRGVEVGFFQSNHEGAIVDAIHKAYFDGIDCIIINPAAYTHTSIAIADALKAVGIPTAEVHVSDVNSRESFRQISYVRAYCEVTVCGKGLEGYNLAMDMLLEKHGK